MIQEQHAGGWMWMPSSFLFAVNSFYFCISRAVWSLVFSVHYSSLSFFIFIAQWIECVILHWQAPKKPQFCWVTLSKSPNCFNRVLLFASKVKKKKKEFLLHFWCKYNVCIGPSNVRLFLYISHEALWSFVRSTCV